MVCRKRWTEDARDLIFISCPQTREVYMMMGTYCSKRQLPPPPSYHHQTSADQNVTEAQMVLEVVNQKVDNLALKIVEQMKATFLTGSFSGKIALRVEPIVLDETTTLLLKSRVEKLLVERGWEAIRLDFIRDVYDVNRGTRKHVEFRTMYMLYYQVMWPSKLNLEPKSS